MWRRDCVRAEFCRIHQKKTNDLEGRTFASCRSQLGKVCTGSEQLAQGVLRLLGFGIQRFKRVVSDCLKVALISGKCPETHAPWMASSLRRKRIRLRSLDRVVPSRLVH
jgi:hypothetical protein